MVPEAIETERAATPARVGLNQHIQRLSHLAMPVLAVTNKADVHRTLAAGKRRAASRPKPNNFGAEGASARNPGPTPLPDESGKGFFSSVDRPPTVIRYPRHATGATAGAEEDLRSSLSPGSSEVGNVAWNAPNNLASPAQAGTCHSPRLHIAQARRFS